MANEVWFRIDKNPDGYPTSKDWEGLHCEIIDADLGKFQVKNVPFYLRNVAYNDLILAKKNTPGFLEFESILERSGWSVYRLLVADEAKLDDTINKLESMGLEVEEENGLIALAVPPEVDSELVTDFILEGKRCGDWGAQDGFIFE